MYHDLRRQSKTTELVVQKVWEVNFLQRDFDSARMWSKNISFNELLISIKGND
jgi:hypothetical protein